MLNIFSSKKKPGSLKQAKELAKKCEELASEIKSLRRELAGLKKESEFFVQKVGIIRFNPFEEQGGDQSFSAAFLDGNDNGLIVTALHGQQETRVYGKPIEHGKSKYILSKEEREALDKAAGRKL